MTTKTNREFKVAHTETVISGVFSPDSRTLATGCTDGTLVVWEVANGVPLRDLNTAGGGVASLAFSPDGRLLVAGNNDGTVQVWDPSLGVEIHSFSAHTHRVASLAFSSDNQVLASAGFQDGRVCFWDAQTFAPLPHSWCCRGQIRKIAFSPRDPILAVGVSTGELILWDVRSRQRVGTRLHRYAVTALAFSPDGGMVAVGLKDGTLSCYALCEEAETRGAR